jgi:hypothetical protein
MNLPLIFSPKLRENLFITIDYIGFFTYIYAWLMRFATRSFMKKSPVFVIFCSFIRNLFL